MPMTVRSCRRSRWRSAPKCRSSRWRCRARPSTWRGGATTRSRGRWWSRGSAHRATDDPALLHGTGIEYFAQADADQIEGGGQERDPQCAGAQHPPGDVSQPGEHLLPGQTLVDEVTESDASPDRTAEVEECLGDDCAG